MKPGRLVAIVGFTVFSVMFSISVVGPLLSSLTEEEKIPLGGKPNTSIGIIFALGGLALAVAQVPIGRLADRMDKKKIIGVGGLVVSSSILGIAYTDRIAGLLSADPALPGGWHVSTLLLALFRAIQGLGAAATWPVAMAILAASMPEDEMGKAMGVYGASFGLGMGLGPVVGPALAGSTSVRTPLILSSILALAAVATAFMLPQSEKAGGERAKGKAPMDSRVFILGLTGFTLLYAMGGLVVIYPKYLLDVVGVSIHDIAVLLGAASLSFTLLQPLTGRVIDRADRRLISSLFLVAASASVYLAASTSSFTLMTIAMLVFGVSGAVIYPAITSLVALIAPPGREGAYTGMFNALSSLGVTLSPIAIGLAADLEGYKAAFSTPLLLALPVSVLLLSHRGRG